MAFRLNKHIPYTQSQKIQDGYDGDRKYAFLEKPSDKKYDTPIVDNPIDHEELSNIAQEVADKELDLPSGSRIEVGGRLIHIVSKKKRKK